MTALNATNFDAALKIKYREGIEKAVLEKSPFCALMEKVPFPGKQKDLVIDVAHAGASPVFSVAQARKSSSTKYAFNVTRSKLYVLGSIDGETDEASAGGGAVAQALSDLLDQKTTEFAHAMSWNAWNGQGGAVGQIATGGISTVTVTLTAATDHVNFNVGDEVELSTTNTASSTPHSSGATATITGVDRKAGTLTTDSNWTTQISGAAAADFIFKEGCTGNMAAGATAWVSTADTPAALYGLTRTTDPIRMAGNRFDATGLDPASALIQANARLRENSPNRADIYWLSPRRYADFEMSLEGKANKTRVYGKTSGGIAIGFDAIQYGKISVMEDPFCPNAFGLLTQKKGVWKLGCTKSGVPHFHTRDGNKLSREPNADADEFRLKAYYAIENHSPVSSIWVGHAGGFGA